MEEFTELFEEILAESDEVIFKKLIIHADAVELEVTGEGAGELPTDLLLSLITSQEKK
ncbi:MAG: hypothetical protein HWN67_15650 [Candidatus Helarchaeota archaeon]|nr:hypothetical protein [Candidatus Helarchaeota archaeon]